jgi:hypothetical protein
VLEFGDIRWQLQAISSGTRLTLWHNIDHRFISWGAAGWHIAFDVLARYLSGECVNRTASAGLLKSAGWQRLRDEYAKQFDSEPSN